MGKSAARSHGERGAARWAWVAGVVVALVAGVVWWSWPGEESAAPERVAVGAPAEANGGEVVRQAVLVPPVPAEDEALAPSSSRAVAVAEGDPAPVARKVVVLCVDARSGEPVPHAEVHVIGEDSIPDEEFERAMASGDGMQAVIASVAPAHRADAAGRVVVPWPTDADGLAAAGLVAFVPGRMAMREPFVPSEGEVRLEFADIEVLEARVVDVRERPVAGVLVELRDDGYAVLATRTGADGVARFELPPTIAELAEDSALTCMVAGLFEEPVEMPVDVNALPSAPVELRLPPFGYVSVSASREGRTGALSVELGPSFGVGTGTLSGTLRDEPWVAGPVAFGMSVSAVGGRTSATVPWRAQGEGPTVEGEVVELVLVRDRALRVTGRAVTEDGEPLARVLLELTAIRPHGGAVVLGNRFRCNRRGEFDVEVAAQQIEPATHLHLRARQREPELAATVPLANGWPERFEDVVFAPLPPIARGRWVDRAGRAVAKVHLLVCAVPLPGQDDGARSEAAPPVAIPHTVHSSPDGRFEVLGQAPADASLRLSASLRGFVPSDREVRVGEDVGDWVLERNGRVRGRLVVDTHVPLEELRVSVGNWLGASAVLDDDGSFELDDVEAGELELLLGGNAWVGPQLELWKGAVTAGSEVDVGTIDVRGLVARTELDVRDASGDPVTVVLFSWSADVDPRRAAQSVPPWGSVTRGDFTVGFMSGASAPRLLHRAAPFDGEVTTGGHRTAAVRLVGGYQRVDLRPALEVALRIVGAPAAHPSDPEGPAFFANLVSAEDAGDIVTGGLLVDGVARLAVPRPGTYTARLTLRTPLEVVGSAPLPDVQVLDTPELQVFEFAMPELAR